MGVQVPEACSPSLGPGVGEEGASAVPRGSRPERVQFSSEKGGSSGRGEGLSCLIWHRGGRGAQGSRLGG